MAEAGIILNLEHVRTQLEGSVLFGLSRARYGEISTRDAATELSNLACA